MMKYLAATLIVFLAVNAKADSDIEKLVNPILESIQDGKIAKLATLAFPAGSANRAYLTDADIRRLDSQFESIQKTLGKSHGYRLLHEVGILDVYIIQYFLFRNERQPTLVKIELYKPEEHWQVHGFEIDGELDVYFEEAAKFSIGSSALEGFEAFAKQMDPLKHEED